MPRFLLEIYRPGLDRAGGEALAGRVRDSLEQLRDPAVRYAGSELGPIDEVCFVRIDAPSSEVIEQVVRGMRIGGARVSEVVDLG